MFDSIWIWVGFNIAVVFLLILDFFVLTRGDHVINIREAVYLTGFWTLIAAGAGVWIYFVGGGIKAGEYFAAYVAERALSIDNLFVFLVIFGYFNMPKQYQARALLFGIVGALIARAAFIAVGLTLITYFSWILFILGAFLVYTAYKLAFTGDQELDPGKNIVVRVFRRFMRVSDVYDGHKLFTRTSVGVLAATPFLLVIISLGTTDIVFAVDSIPTVLGISKDSFIVWSSNAMAVLGMRPLFFLLEGMVRLFRFLQYGLAAILGYIGVKMIIEESLRVANVHDPHIIGEQGDVFLSLGIIITILAMSVIVSVIFPKKPAHHEESSLNIADGEEDI